MREPAGRLGQRRVDDVYWRSGRLSKERQYQEQEEGGSRGEKTLFQVSN